MTINNVKKISVIVALGNPGATYKNTYHNAGYMGLHEFIKISGEDFRLKKKSLFSWAQAHNLVVAISETNMNNSGTSVKSLLSYFKRKPNELLVLHDDADILLGEYKLSFGRGAAGHHGIESIQEYIKTKEFWRLRIGIRKHRGKAESFVLSKISAADKKKLYSAIWSATKKLIENESPSGPVLTSVSGRSMSLK